MADTSDVLAQHPVIEALRHISIFSDLSQDDLEWLAQHGTEIRLAPGEVLFREGDPANLMYAILVGEMRYQRESAGGTAPVYVGRAGEVSGVLPFSRMTTFGGIGRAVTDVWLLTFKRELFPEMLSRMPVLNQRFVWAMADRIREATRVDELNEKLIALGKLSAGLAHELNNPAAAIRRSAEMLARSMSEMRAAGRRFYDKEHTAQQRRELLQIEDAAAEAATTLPALDVLERSDREQAIAAWLESNGLDEAYSYAGTLSEGGVDVNVLAQMKEVVGPELMQDVVPKLSASLTIARLIDDITQSAGKISEIVTVIKEYSYMDQTPLQEVDVHRGLENTLLMFHHRLKHGIRIVRDYDPQLPPICAYGGELNQVWTNLIDNALDAMGERGTLSVSTRREEPGVCIQITDSGPGIPEDVQGRIFEPFFTTKPVGQGTGLGLDVVQRIIRRHHGSIRLESVPGDTRFEIRLPLIQPG